MTPHALLASCPPRARRGRSLARQRPVRCSAGELPRSPRPELGPREAVEAVLFAMQRGELEGLDVAFDFSLRPGESRAASPAPQPGQPAVLGWAPRRTRLVPPAQSRDRFCAALRDSPYAALLRADAAWVSPEPPAFRGAEVGGAEECELRVLSVSVAEGAAERGAWTFRLRRPEQSAFAERARCWLIKHVAAAD